MKYWLGYVIAAVFAAGTVAIRRFAEAHQVLVDMVYPYVSRLVQTTLADISSQVPFALWQTLLLGLVAVGLAIIVLTIVFRWNVIRVGGWLLAGVSLVVFLNVGVFGLNEFAGDLSDDIRLNMTDYTIDELESAADYYREQATTLADQISRDSVGNADYPAFSQLAEMAGSGFQNLTYQDSFPVFAGSTLPVKELIRSSYYAGKGVSGMTVGITGESSVNPLLPDVYLPFAMCREMAKRMSIGSERDASFSAYLACRENDDIRFQYSAYLIAFRYCRDALESLGEGAPQIALTNQINKLTPQMQQDLAACDSFFRNTEDSAVLGGVVDMLASWYIQEIYLPEHKEEEIIFDPMDETQVDLSGIVNAG